MEKRGLSDEKPPELAELHRLTFGIAYRMLGSVADAEDIVQESILRLHRARAEGTVIESERRFLAAVATRLAIDQLRSARARRETYPGSWLPEPIVGDEKPNAAQQAELAESISMAFLLVLETLSPVERAVFLLREVFDYEYDEISDVVGKEEDNCRQILSRAKHHMDTRKPRFETSAGKRDELATRFFRACETGDVGEFARVLAEDVAFYGDGGGKANAVLQPVVGRDKVLRLLENFSHKGREVRVRIQQVRVNGQPGALVLDPQDRLISVFALDIVDGAIQAIRGVVNPDKLRHLGELSDAARLPNRMSQNEPQPGLE